MTNPDALAKRLLHRAHARDGLAEILVSLLFFWVAAFQYADWVLPHRSLLFRVSDVVFALGWPAAAFLGPRGLSALRRRYLVQREGYVEHLPQPHRFRRAWLAGVVAVLVVLALGAFRSSAEFWITVFTGVGGGCLGAFCGRAPRFYFVGAVMAAGGLAIAFARLPMAQGFFILFSVMGVLELIFGTIGWFRFLRETREAVSR
jgi:hypothetical protein